MSANSEVITAAERIVLLSRLSRNDCCAPADDHGSIAAAKRALGPNHTDPAAWSCDTSEKTIEVCDLTTDSNVNNPNRSVTLGGGSRYVDNAPRIAFSSDLFNEYGDDLPDVPTLLTGVMSDWPSMQPGPHRWSVASLASRGTGPHDPHFSVDGGPGFARMSMADARVGIQSFAADYCLSDSQSDLAPLYIFDPAIDTRTFADGTRYADEFAVPDCFAQDTMKPLQGTVYRPLPPGWLLVGPKRSGTPIHDHPHTVAWNALLEGTKLWVCLPPDVDPNHLLLLGDDSSECGSEDSGGEGDDDDGVFDLEAMAWFQNWNCDGGDALPETASVIVQQEGEVVFLPAGWWHVVLNCSAVATVALSLSLGLRRDFERTWPLLLEEDADFASAWRLAKAKQEEESA
mmetsp:Transcript_3855/g.4198  ORF Transcript_3855/g.4198 Transcript_3855/m.4198 type:complete len:401 (+) Transcript_3855:54-1256(+)